MNFYALKKRRLEEERRASERERERVSERDGERKKIFKTELS